MDPATLKFEQALPYALQPSHPRLAALHAARTRAIPPTACPRCGSMEVLRTRVARGKQNTRTIVATCRVCRGASSAPIQKGNAAAFPPYRRRSVTVHAAPPRPVPVTVPPHNQPIALSNTRAFPVSSQAPHHPVPDPPLSSRPSTKKKKSALQEMLQRNREKEKKRTDSTSGKTPGLSAFLSTL